ncbi:hypothetical protein Tco_0751348 [Tanacetum coccineum]|uniref:Uncharacterized protein n=1 Tax=Tanacetum coccineum TaxID=301880 RepID=A0ABQ4Z726_9ASTR
MKVEESLNVTFDETPSPPKTSPLEDDDLAEEEAIKEVTRRCLEALELKGGDGGACKLLGDFIKVLGCWLELLVLHRSIISTGSSTKLSLSSSQSSFIGMTRDSSDKHFFRLEMWKVL